MFKPQQSGTRDELMDIYKCTNNAYLQVSKKASDTDRKSHRHSAGVTFEKNKSKANTVVGSFSIVVAICSK